MRHWNRLFREVEDALSLKTVKVMLDRTLGNLMWSKMSLPMAEGLD